jgi:hypothetical protein
MPDRRHDPRRLLAWALLGFSGITCAQALTPQNLVFTCVNAAGRTLTSDRLIGECMDREQRMLARDGTLIRVVPPSLTADERADKEARERKVAAEREARAEAVRRDRNLVQRFPNVAAHQKAREQALEVVQYAITQSEARMGDLQRERKPLAEELEFYAGKQVPSKLQAQIDANDAAAQAQKDLLEQQKAELDRVSKLYDIELAHLKRLWAGAQPGSLAQAPAPDVNASRVKPAVGNRNAN